MKRRPPTARPASRLFLPLLAVVVLFGYISLRGAPGSHHVLPDTTGRSSRAAGSVPPALRASEAEPAVAAVEEPQAEAAGGVQSVPLLSRRTPAWDALLAEGLFHPNSGYAKIDPPSDKEAGEWAQWQAKVKAEFPNGARSDQRSASAKLTAACCAGCKPGTGDNATKRQCLPKIFIMGQARHRRCLLSLFARNQSLPLL